MPQVVDWTDQKFIQLITDNPASSNLKISDIENIRVTIEKILSTSTP